MLHPLSKESIIEDISVFGADIKPEEIQQKLSHVVSILWNVENNEQILANYRALCGEDEIFDSLVKIYEKEQNIETKFYLLIREEVRMMIHKIIKDNENFDLGKTVTNDFIKQAIIEEDDFTLSEEVFPIVRNFLGFTPQFLFTGSWFTVIYNLYYLSTKNKIFFKIRKFILTDIQLYKTSYDLKCAILSHLIEEILSSAIDFKLQNAESRSLLKDKLITGKDIQIKPDLIIALN